MSEEVQVKYSMKKKKKRKLFVMLLLQTMLYMTLGSPPPLPEIHLESK